MPIHESKHQVRIAMLGLALASMMAGPSEAQAQPPAAGPDEAACEGKRSGEACTLINGSAGACGPGTCSRLDYSQGSPPKATEESCVVCVPGAVSNEGPPALGETTGTEPTEPSEPSSAGEAKASETEKDEPPQTSSRCSVTDRSTPSDLGWLTLLLLPLAATRRRRRSR